MSAARPKAFCCPATEARNYLLFLVFSYTLLSGLGGLFVGMLLYGITTHNYTRAFVSVFMCFSFFSFLRRPGRMLLRDLHRRRRRALLRQGDDKVANPG